MCLVEYDDNRIWNDPDRERRRWNGEIPGIRGGLEPIDDVVCNEPSPAPTTDPTNDPTTDPTNDPTPDPTVEPTYTPTISPVVSMCPELMDSPDRTIDVVVLVDVSGNLGNNTDIPGQKECARQQQFIAEVMSSFKEPTTDCNNTQSGVPCDVDGAPTQSRVAYMLYGPEGSNLNTRGDDWITKWSLTNDINIAPLSFGDYLTGYYWRVRNQDCGDYNDELGPTTNLYDAFGEAIRQFSYAQSDSLGRDKKIVVLSNRPNTKSGPNGEDLCAEYEDKIRDQETGIDVVFINIPEDSTVEDPFSGPNTSKETYESCLVRGDHSGRIVSFEKNKNLKDPDTINEAIDTVMTQVCEDPSPSPTSDPTADPTTDPTREPTPSPTEWPTFKPTSSPIQCDCKSGMDMDLQILVDLSCVSDIECEEYTEGIAELFSSIKGEFAIPRIGVFTFDEDSVDVVVKLNDTDFNGIDQYDSTTTWKIGLAGKSQYYDMIKNIQCSSQNTGYGQDTNVMAAIQAAMQIFEYEEDYYLPSIERDVYNSRTRTYTTIDYTKRDKKIAIFSTCLASTGGNEDAVCSAYEAQTDRYIYDTSGVNTGEVEITVFNVITQNGNIPSPFDYLYCLTENDLGRQFVAGAKGYDITWKAMTERIDAFQNEICDEPTKAPTSEPTMIPTPNPTEEPTDQPTSPPTLQPTNPPIPPEEPRCTCDNLGYKLVNGDYVGNGGCNAYSGCNYDPNCFTMRVIPQTPKLCNPDCKTSKSAGYEPHIPDYIIIEPKESCPVSLDQEKYLYQMSVQCALEDGSGLDLPDDIDGKDENGNDIYPQEMCPADQWYSMDIYEWFSDSPDPITGANGLEIPLNVQYWGYDGTYTFELCLWGVTSTVTTNIGWGFTVPGCTSQGGGIQYGMTCETDNIPDLCEDQIAYEAKTGINPQNNRLPDDDGIDLLKPGDRNSKEMPNSPSSPFYSPSSLQNGGVFAMYSAYSQWIFSIIMAIFVLNIFVCVYIKCIRGKHARHKSYGFVSKYDDDDSGSSDGTDSEVDSDSDEQLIE